MAERQTDLSGLKVDTSGDASRFDGGGVTLVRRWNRFLPERQVLVRTDGRVRHVVVSSRLQLAMIGVVAAALGWSSFVSVNFLGHERELAERAGRLEATRAAYRSLVDELAGYERRLAGVVTSLDGDHRLIVDVLDRNRNLDRMLSQTEAQLTAVGEDRDRVAGQRDALQQSIEAREGDLGTLAGRNAALDDLLSERGLRLAYTRLDHRHTRSAIAALEQRAGRLDGRLAGLQALGGVFMGTLAERAEAEAEALLRVVMATGLNPEPRLAALERRQAPARGGPFIATEVTVTDQEAGIDHTLGRLDALRALISHLPLAAPLDGFRLSSGFGVRVNPVTKKKAPHNGIDLVAPKHTPIFAPAPGIVRRAGWERNFGKMVEIDHGNGIRTLYGHMSMVTVKRGQRVDFRDEIGELGATGRTTGAHLHYEVHVDETPVDPWRFVAAGRKLFHN